MEKYKSVLLIDDDPVSNFLHHSIITNLGIAEEINIKGNGEAALKFIREYHSSFNSLPSLILLDINMPIMDGFEFLEEFEKSDYMDKDKTKIVVVSNLFRKSDIDILNELAYPKYLYKPLNKRELKNIIEEEVEAGQNAILN
jgi:CheY-like chemotaxis protein